MSAIARFLPRRRLSQWIGAVVHWKGPKFWAEWSVKIFANYYKINLNEAEHAIEKYPSIGAFFTRHLKAGLRPVATDALVTHPADSKLTQWGALKHGHLIQAKGKLYSGLSFLANEELYEKLHHGLFMTYYLCPTDYHRVHSPLDGEILEVIHVPGDLWPVNEWSTENIHEVFNLNERIIVVIQTQWGPVALVFVGATNVGSIHLSFDKSFVGNDPTQLEIRHHKYENPKAIKKGDELGYFAMGSTVVMIYPEEFKNLYEGKLQGLGEQVFVNGTLVLK